MSGPTTQNNTGNVSRPGAAIEFHFPEGIAIAIA
jgi:hypothetical protein